MILKKSRFHFYNLISGREEVHVLTIRTWNERLDHLTKDNRYVEALQLGCEFYEDQGKALVGLKGPREKRKNLIAQKVISDNNCLIILQAYFSNTLMFLEIFLKSMHEFEVVKRYF